MDGSMRVCLASGSQRVLYGDVHAGKRNVTLLYVEGTNLNANLCVKKTDHLYKSHASR
jgi:hypothetical protein